MTVEHNADLTLFWLYCNNCGTASEVPAPTEDRAIAAATLPYLHRRWKADGDWHLCPTCQGKKGALTRASKGGRT